MSFWSQTKCWFTASINSRMVAVSVVVLVVAGLLLFLVIPVATIKPPQQVVNITPIADNAPSAPVRQTVAGEQASSSSKAVEAPPALDQPWRNETPRQPLAGSVILAYGWQFYPVFNEWRYHTGIDISSAPGAPVTAALSGIVVSSGEAKHTGLTVVISSGRRQIIYGCLSRTRVTVGQKISQGNVIGFTGQSQDEPYPHLHIAIMLDDEYQDPQQLFY